MTALTKVANIYLVKVVLVIISGHRQKDLYLFCSSILTTYLSQ